MTSAAGSAGRPALSWQRVAAFALGFAALHAALLQVPGSAWEPWLIDRMTVAPAAWWIDWLRPADEVGAAGARLVWPGGRIARRQGCDALDVMALYGAAAVVVPLRWLARTALLLGGVELIWLLNQARVVALYVAYRDAPGWFDPLHSVWGPLVLVATAAALIWLALRLRL